MQFTDLAVGPDPQLPRGVFERRRDRVQGDLIVSTHPETTYSNDVHHVFRPQSDFWYLTGFAEPGCVLVIVEGTSHLFLRPRRPEAEIWTGRRLGVERACDVLGVDQAYALDELPTRLPDLVRQADAIIEDPAVAETVANAHIETSETQQIAEMRLRKDADEVRLLQKACDVAAAGHEAAREQVRAGNHEYQVEAAFTQTIRAAGSTGNGYPPIVGAGANAAILHYIDNRAPIRDGDLVLIDAGCEWGYYNSDITRTHCAGEPDRAQQAILELVEAARVAAIKKVRPGNRFRDPHDEACRVLVEGLLDLEILKGNAEKVVKENEHRRFFMHGTSHFLGLDVHDVGRPRTGQDAASRELEEGMCLTIEPGLYFNPDFTTCPEPYRDIGVRVEDDVLVTADGPRVLSRSP